MGRALRNLTKEIGLYENHIKGARDLSKKKNLDTTKIQIGGGSHTLRDYLNIDIVPPADIIYDLREGIPLKDESSEFIFTEHFLEHIDYPTSTKKFAKECFRVLKKGGRVVVGVPDGEQVIKAYVKKDKRFFDEMLKRWYSKRDCLEHFNTYIDLVNYHFRDQDDDKKYNPHFWSYDFEKLVSLFKDAGFSEVKKWKFDSSIANSKRWWGSIYIIATK